MPASTGRSRRSPLSNHTTKKMNDAKPFIDPDTVTDRDSFVRFVEYLVADRVAASEVEKTDPQRYQWGGAAGWQNTEIPAFLEGALAGSLAQRDWGADAAPSWRDLAIFLYLGKIYE
jgi:hypothetical protein